MQSPIHYARSGCALLLLGCPLLTPLPAPAAAPARAAALTVTNTNDAGPGSLRQAIADSPDGGTIDFSLPAGVAITLTSGELVIDKTLTVSGPGASRLAISGNNASRVFLVSFPGAADISGLTIRDGRAVGAGGASGGADGRGGGVLGIGSLTLTGCVVSNNRAVGGDTPSGSAGPAFGGGVFAFGPLTVIDSRVSDNSALGGHGTGTAGPGVGAEGGPANGGGIFSNHTLTLVNSAVTDNRAAGGNGVGNGAGSGGHGGGADGGGIGHSGGVSSATIINSTVSNNSATGGNSSGGERGGEASGGGISEVNALTLTNSTLSNNTAAGGSGPFAGSRAYGGGLHYTAFNFNALTLTNSTISGNSARGGGGTQSNGAYGGGIHVGADHRSLSSVLRAVNCTVTLNSAAAGVGTSGGRSDENQGGGIRADAGTLDLLNVIVAGNSIGADGQLGTAGPDLFENRSAGGRLTSQGHNLVGVNEGAAVSFPAGVPNANGDLVGTPGAPLDARLGPLADNGGPTRTHLPQPGGPAVDAGDDSALGPPLTLTTDQRGAGFPRLLSAAIDIGAVETPGAAVVLQFAAADFVVDEGAGKFLVTVTRAGSLNAGGVTVEYTTSNGTASDRSDYNTAFGTLRFEAGETSKTFAVFITGDAHAEGDEVLSLALGGPAGGGTLGGQSTATLTIRDDDKAPSAANPIDATAFFVRQHYVDFLGREPDDEGLAHWTNVIDSCGQDAQCREVRRINVSAAFFLSIEFQETGYLVQRMYRAAYDDAAGASSLGGPHLLRVPAVRLRDFLADAQQLRRGVVVNQGEWKAQLEANKQAFMLEFVQRPRFVEAFPPFLFPNQFVDRMNASAGGPLDAAERQALIDELTANNTASGRASVLRKVAEDATLVEAEKNRAFVLMQYFGYLRRNPNDAPDSDYTGYDFWLGNLNRFNGNFVGAEMVKAFLSSVEYRQRFGGLDGGGAAGERKSVGKCVFW